MRKTAQLAVLAIVCGIVGFACVSVATAQVPESSSKMPDLSSDPVGLVRALYDAATAKRWSVVVGIALIGVSYAVRRFVLGRVAWFQTRVGGVAIAVGLSLLGTFGLALASSAPMTGALALDALATAMTAAGGWAWLQHALEKKPADGGGN